MFKYLLDGIYNLIYPPKCLVCKKPLETQIPTKLLCLKCLDSIKFNIPPFCPKCSRHLGKNPQMPRCKNCTKILLHFDFAWCSCLYVEPLRKLIQNFKYNQKTLLRRQFTQFMISFIETYNLDITQFDIIVPIPLHPTRLRERGYNQSLLLAHEISEHFNINLNINTLIRTRNTKNQTLLSKKERWTNIAEAFTIKNPKNIYNKSVLLIDDLLTTGATSSEAAKELKNVGAKTVGVFALAITPLG